MPGATRNRVVDALLVALFWLTVCGAIAHALLRVVTRRNRSRMSAAAEKVRMYPVWLRVWHWSNAVLFIVLAYTGLRMHFGQRRGAIMSFETAFNLHNLAGGPAGRRRGVLLRRQPHQSKPAAVPVAPKGRFPRDPSTSTVVLDRYIQGRATPLPHGSGTQVQPATASHVRRGHVRDVPAAIALGCGPAVPRSPAERRHGSTRRVVGRRDPLDLRRRRHLVPGRTPVPWDRWATKCATSMPRCSTAITGTVSESPDPRADARAPRFAATARLRRVPERPAEHGFVSWSCSQCRSSTPDCISTLASCGYTGTKAVACRPPDDRHRCKEQIDHELMHRSKLPSSCTEKTGFISWLMSGIALILASERPGKMAGWSSNGNIGYYKLLQY